MEKKDIYLAASTIAIFVLFFLSNIPHENMYDLTIEFDHVIPLIPVFIIPYFSYFLLLPTTALRMFRTSLLHLRFFLVAVFVTLIFSHACFWCFPTHLTVRPEITNTDLFSKLTKLLHYYDSPYAACPSVHANMSTLCAVMWWKIKHRLSYVMIAWASIVIASTVLMKQHFVLDVVVGILTAFVFYFATAFFMPDVFKLVENSEV